MPNSRPNRKPSKPSKKAAKKTAKRGVASKGATPRKATQEQKRNRNKELLAGDIAFYENQEHTNYGRRTKGNKDHPRGVRLDTLREDVNGIWHSDDNTIRLTKSEYNALAKNPDAIPQYTPIYKGKKIVKYRNTRTGQFVKPYYRHQVFGKYFNRVVEGTPEERTRSELYREALTAQTHARVVRHFNLAESYQLLHPEMTKQQIVASEDFQILVGRLRSFNYIQYGITEENVEIIDEVQHTTLSIEDFKLALGEDEEYKEVLILLGRRLPSDSGAVGESDRDHIKNVVQPYYAAKTGAIPFSEGEE